jgi:hypothetical protein
MHQKVKAGTMTPVLVSSFQKRIWNAPLIQILLLRR